MVARRSDNRRRRVFVESSSPESMGESSGNGTSPARVSNSARTKVLYAPGAERRHQHKTTDLIPKRVWAVVALIGGLLAIVIALNLIAYHSPAWEPSLGAESIQALRLTGRGTIAAWFSSLLFIISGLASLQIYALRQHRRDDYQGSFRIWLWMSALLILASANCVVDLGSLVLHAVQNWLQSPGSSATGSYWIFTVKMILLSLLIARGIFEIKESRATLAMVMLVWAAYLGASVLQLPNSFNAINQLTVQQQDIVTGNLQFIAVIGLFLAQLTFARFIYLQATGLVKSKKRKKAIAKSKKKSPVKPRTKTDALKAQPATVAATPVHNSGSAEDKKIEQALIQNERLQPSKFKKADARGDRDEEDDESESILSMSKSQRRRQRKTTKEARRAA